MKITEKIFLWDYLKTISGSKPIVLYGMGSGADKILDLCQKKGIEISGVFASDEFVRGHWFRGFKVKKLSEIREEYKDFCILTAFATREDEVIDRIYKLDETYELYAPNFPVFGDGYFDGDFLNGNIENLKKAYLLLSDNISKEVYVNAVNFMISGKLKYLRNMETSKSDALGLLDLRGGLHYVDAGAYNGDTVLEIKDYSDRITAFEPDKKNFEKLKKNMLENNLSDKCELYNIGVWSEEKILRFDSKAGKSSSFNSVSKKKYADIPVNSMDNMLKSRVKGEILIKYDVEGAEYEALKGTELIIKEKSPKLIVSLYHRIEDIFKLLLLIHGMNLNYNFYIRKHKYIPCWDLNLYAAPKQYS